MLRTIKIIYEDKYLLVVDKPAGLLVVPTVKNERATLTNILRDEGFQVYPCHRLDRDTTGLIVYAKDKKTRSLMMEGYQRHEIKKTYLAFLRGGVKRPSGEIRADIIEKGRSLSARTDYRVIYAGEDFSVAEAYPQTGRTNQIRIHFRSIGHPLLGERKFALARESVLKFRRAALHASGLKFRHPYENKVLSLRAELPADMSDFLKRHDVSLEDGGYRK